MLYLPTQLTDRKLAMLHRFVNAFREAVQSGHLHAASSAIESEFEGLSIALEVGDDQSQPFVVVGWQISSEINSHLMISSNLTEHKRADFALNRLGYTIPIIAQYHKAGTPIVGHVNINLEDHAVWPGLSYCDFGAAAYLLPDPVFISTSGYDQIRKYFASNPVPWEDRLPVCFWRGSTTGRLQDVASWRQLPRIRLCEIAAQRSDLFDVGISQVIGLEAFAEDIAALGIVKNYIPAEELQKFRYHIDIDGNSNSWPGLFQKLLTGSPVLKVNSPFGFQQWYYERLGAWVNYVPVQADMSDLVEKVNWLKRHDKAARLIGDAGRDLALSLRYKDEIGRSVGTVCSALRASGWSDFLKQCQSA